MNNINGYNQVERLKIKLTPEERYILTNYLDSISGTYTNSLIKKAQANYREEILQISSKNQDYIKKSLRKFGLSLLKLALSI